jgi:hypothetical protein
VISCQSNKRLIEAHWASLWQTSVTCAVAFALYYIFHGHADEESRLVVDAPKWVS